LTFSALGRIWGFGKMASTEMATDEITDQANADLEKALRDAVRVVMATETAKPADYARVQELLERKAARLRTPFSNKLRRVIEAA
jgi:hypothetical protein